MSTPAAHPAPAPDLARRKRWTAGIVGASILIASGVALSSAIAGLRWYTKKLPINVDLKCPSIPTSTDSWEQVGSDQRMTEATLETLGTHNYVDRAFVERHPADPKNPRLVRVHLAYYTGSVDTVPHVPERCFVAGGASITDGPFVKPVPLNKDAWIPDTAASAEYGQAMGLKDATIYSARLGPNSRAPGNRVHLPYGIENLDIRISEYAVGKNDQDKTYAGYFFIANGALTSSAQNVRLLAFDLHSDYAFYLKVQFSATHIKGPDELAQIAASVLNEMLPDIMGVVPDWPDVIRGDYPADNPRRKTNTPELSGR